MNELPFTAIWFDANIDWLSILFPWLCRLGSDWYCLIVSPFIANDAGYWSIAEDADLVCVAIRIAYSLWGWLTSYFAGSSLPLEFESVFTRFCYIICLIIFELELDSGSQLECCYLYSVY